MLTITKPVKDVYVQNLESLYLIPYTLYLILVCIDKSGKSIIP